jgi:hypothetical protein
MKPHKWAKEIIAWANGAEIEELIGSTWHQVYPPQWHRDSQYRIKPQQQQSSCCQCQQTSSALKEPQYLLAVRLTDGSDKLGISGEWVELKKGESVHHVIGKIKLETDNE